MQWYYLIWGCRWGTLGQKLKLSRFKLCHCACTWVHKAAQQPLWNLPVWGGSPSAQGALLSPAAEAAWQEIFFVLRVFGANPLHCLYFSQNIKRQREKIWLTQNRWQKILASHLPAMPRKTLFSFAPLLGFVRFQGLRSCNAYNLWFRMPPAKSNRPTCLRWIPQRSCWRFLTCSKRWNDASVARMWDYWCW